MILRKRWRTASYFLGAAAMSCLAASEQGLEVDASPSTSSPSPALPPLPPEWPAADAPLSLVDVVAPPGFGKRRVVIDPGHGASNNTGPVSVECELEQDFMLGLAQDLAARLTATGLFEVRVSREAGATVEYRPRLRDAEAWGAELVVSLHSDVRGEPWLWRIEEGRWCYRSDQDLGFAVLWSDAGVAALAQRRHELAARVAVRMAEAGFVPYDGNDYPGLYDADAAVAGIFVDRHVPGHRIYMLRHSRVPLVIVETHHALSLDEVERWREERTRVAFAQAIAAAMVDVLAPLVTAAEKEELRHGKARAQGR